MGRHESDLREHECSSLTDHDAPTKTLPRFFLCCVCLRLGQLILDCFSSLSSPVGALDSVFVSPPACEIKCSKKNKKKKKVPILTPVVWIKINTLFFKHMKEILIYLCWAVNSTPAHSKSNTPPGVCVVYVCLGGGSSSHKVVSFLVVLLVLNFTCL